MSVLVCVYVVYCGFMPCLNEFKESMLRNVLNLSLNDRMLCWLKVLYKDPSQKVQSLKNNQGCQKLGAHYLNFTDHFTASRLNHYRWRRSWTWFRLLVLGKSSSPIPRGPQTINLVVNNLHGLWRLARSLGGLPKFGVFE